MSRERRFDSFTHDEFDTWTPGCLVTALVLHTGKARFDPSGVHELS